MKKEIDHHYDNCFGPGDEDEWSYSADTDMWYEDATEVLPMPSYSSQHVKDLSCELKIGYFVNYDGEEQVIENEEETDRDGNPLIEFSKYLIGVDDYYTALSTTIIFKTSPSICSLSLGQKYALCLDQYSMWYLENFVQKLKTKSFVTQYMEKCWSLKLIAWTDKKNKTRFIVQSYHDNFSYKQILFDITIDRDLLVNKLNSVIENWKETVYKAIKEQEKVTGKSVTNPPRDKAIANFFPDLFTNSK